MPKCALPVVAALALSGACSATRLQGSWTAPGLHDEPSRHIVAIAITGDHNRRVALEDALAAQLQSVGEGVQVEASYKTFNDDAMKAVDKVRDLLASGGFDAAIIMRATDVKREDVWLPGSQSVAPMYYRTIWDYYAYWQPIALQPGYLKSQRTVHVETAMFAVPEGDLIYSAISQTVNPASAEELVKQVGDRVAKDLTQKGLISNRRSPR